MDSSAATTVFEAPPLFVSQLLHADKQGLTTQRTVPSTAWNEAANMVTSTLFVQQSEDASVEGNSFLDPSLVEQPP